MSNGLAQPRWPSGLSRKLRIWWQVKVVNWTKFPVRNFGAVRYFDVDRNQYADLRACLQGFARRPGISGFLRLRGEEQFAARAIESVLDCLDELVIVHHDCSNSTREVIETCRQQRPNLIRVYEYHPAVSLPGSPEHRALAMDSPHSLVNYCNYALARTTCKIAIKIDGDELFLPRAFKSVCDDIRSGRLATPMGVSGVNLWDQDGEIQITADLPFKTGIDKGFFTVSPHTFFVHHPNYELFTYAFDRSAGVVYYHLKGMKRDRGLGNYVTKTGETTFSPQELQLMTAPALLPWQSLDSMLMTPAGLPDPAELGLIARRTP